MPPHIVCGCAGSALLCSCSFSVFFFSHKRERHSFKQQPFGAFMGNPPPGNGAFMRHQEEHFFLCVCVYVLQRLSSHMIESLERKAEAGSESRGASPACRLPDGLQSPGEPKSSHRSTNLPSFFLKSTPFYQFLKVQSTKLKCIFFPFSTSSAPPPTRSLMDSYRTRMTLFRDQSHGG